MVAMREVEVIRESYELDSIGVPAYRIAQIVGSTRGTVVKWLKHPEKFSPYIDEVAMERALNGDRLVFENLSLVERREFWQRAATLSEKSFKENLSDPDTGRDRNPWAAAIAADLGLNLMNFNRNCARIRVERR